MNGPSSFGPTESWFYIIFVDIRDIINDNVKISLITLRNTNKIWLNIKVNSTESMMDQKIKNEDQEFLLLLIR